MFGEHEICNQCQQGSAQIAKIVPVSDLVKLYVVVPDLVTDLVAELVTDLVSNLVTLPS